MSAPKKATKRSTTTTPRTVQSNNSTNTSTTATSTNIRHVSSPSTMNSNSSSSSSSSTSSSTSSNPSNSSNSNVAANVTAANSIYTVYTIKQTLSITNIKLKDVTPAVEEAFRLELASVLGVNKYWWTILQLSLAKPLDPSQLLKNGIDIIYQISTKKESEAFYMLQHLESLSAATTSADSPLFDGMQGLVDTLAAAINKNSSPSLQFKFAVTQPNQTTKTQRTITLTKSIDNASKNYIKQLGRHGQRKVKHFDKTKNVADVKATIDEVNRNLRALTMVTALQNAIESASVTDTPKVQAQAIVLLQLFDMDKFTSCANNGYFEAMPYWARNKSRTKTKKNSNINFQIWGFAMIVGMTTKYSPRSLSATRATEEITKRGGGCTTQHDQVEQFVEVDVYLDSIVKKRPQNTGDLVMTAEIFKEANVKRIRIRLPDLPILMPEMNAILLGLDHGKKNGKGRLHRTKRWYLTEKFPVFFNSSTATEQSYRPVVSIAAEEAVRLRDSNTADVIHFPEVSEFDWDRMPEHARLNPFSAAVVRLENLASDGSELLYDACIFLDNAVAAVESLIESGKNDAAFQKLDEYFPTIQQGIEGNDNDDVLPSMLEIAQDTLPLFGAYGKMLRNWIMGTRQKRKLKLGQNPTHTASKNIHLATTKERDSYKVFLFLVILGALRSSESMEGYQEAMSVMLLSQGLTLNALSLLAKDTVAMTLEKQKFAANIAAAAQVQVFKFEVFRNTVEDRKQIAVRVMDNINTGSIPGDPDFIRDGSAARVVSRLSEATFLVTPTEYEVGLSTDSRETVPLLPEYFNGDGLVIVSTFKKDTLFNRGTNPANRKMTCAELDEHGHHLMLAESITNIFKLHASSAGQDWEEVKSYYSTYGNANVGAFWSKVNKYTTSQHLIIPTVQASLEHSTKCCVEQLIPDSILHRTVNETNMFTQLLPHDEKGAGLAEACHQTMSLVENIEDFDIWVGDGLTVQLIRNLIDHLLRSAASNDTNVRYYSLQLLKQLTNCNWMMAELHARGCAASKYLNFEDKLGGVAKRAILGHQRIKYDQVNKNIQSNTDYTRYDVGAHVGAALTDLIENGLKLDDITEIVETSGNNQTGKKRKRSKKPQKRVSVEKVLHKVIDWFDPNNESFGMHGLQSLRNGTLVLLYEHCARYGDAEMFECVLARRLLGLSSNFIGGMYRRITFDMLAQVHRLPELTVFRIRRYGHTIPSPFAVGSGSGVAPPLSEIDDVIEQLNKWIKDMDKANYGWKIRSNMTTCMPKLQQHLRRIKQGHAVNKKGKNRQKSHTLKNLLNLINMSFHYLRAGHGGDSSTLEFLIVQLGNHKRLLNRPGLTALEGKQVLFADDNNQGHTKEVTAVRVRLKPNVVAFEDLSSSELAQAGIFFSYNHTTQKDLLKKEYNAYYKEVADEMLVKFKKNVYKWVPLKKIKVSKKKNEFVCSLKLCRAMKETALEKIHGKYYHRACACCQTCNKNIDVLLESKVKLEKGMNGLTCTECLQEGAAEEAFKHIWEHKNHEKTERVVKKVNIGRGHLDGSERRKLRRLYENNFVTEINAEKYIKEVDVERADRKRKREVVDIAINLEAVDVELENNSVKSTWRQTIKIVQEEINPKRRKTTHEERRSGL